MDTTTRQPRKWTLAEDDKLREEVEAQLVRGDVKDWCRIAAKLPGRTNKDCRKRWHNSVAGGLKKGQWSKSEDQLLSKGMERYGQRWTLVSNCVGSRSADQCAKRWQQSLDPDLDRSEWRDTEDKILIEATQRLGRHWKDIQREHFPGRSKNCIKNRYTVLVRRYQNQGIALPGTTNSPPEPSALTPMSNYLDDEGYLSPSPSTYDHRMQAQPQAGTSDAHHSWSSLDHDAYSSWSSPHEYHMPMAVPDSKMAHAAAHYALVQPQALGSNTSATSTPWNWSSTATDPSSMHAAPRSMVPNMGMSAAPSYYGYEHYPVAAHEPLMSHGAAYGAAPSVRTPYSSTPDRSPGSMHGSSIGEQHGYGAHSPAVLADPRQVHGGMYHQY